MASGKYMRVGSKKGPLLISGAEKKFVEDPSFIYVPMFHVAGPVDEVKTWLKENQSDDSKVALETSYSAKSIKSKKIGEAFQQEVKETIESRNSVSVARSEMKKIDLTVLTKLLKMYDQGRKNRDTETEKVEKKPKDIKSRIKLISKEDKVLEVSKMKEDGSGTSKVTFSDKSKKKRLSQQKSSLLYYVIYNPTSEGVADGVQNFLSMYGGFTESQIRSIIEGVNEGSIINISPTRSPTRTNTKKGRRERVRSPARYVDVDDSE